jgi:predicted Co/Zn/Cd cation transporter (cation efflux family)
MSEEKFVIEIKKRPWYEWLLWGVWLFALVFLVQNAVTSGHELEPRAAAIFWVMFVVFLLGGGVVWFVRRNQ